MNLKLTQLCFAAVGSILISAPAFSSTTYSYATPGNSVVDHEDVSADALFTLSKGTLSITLSNTQNNIKDLNQALDGLTFDLSDSLKNANMSVSATEGWISSKGALTTKTVTSTDWKLAPTKTGAGDIYDQFVLGFIPVDTILPLQSSYLSADSSIKGNWFDNPFLVGPVTFTITDSSLSSWTSLSNVDFDFVGNSCGDPSVRGVLTPEPVSFALTGVGLALVLGGMLRRRTAVAERA